MNQLHRVRILPMIEKKRGKTGRVLFAIAGVLVLIAGISFVLRIVNKVSSGHGLDYYFTGWGVQLNYIGALVLLVVMPLALVVGWAIRWWQLRDERDFRKRFNLPKDSHDSMHLDE